MSSETFVNIDQPERWASVAAGTMLAVAGLRRKSALGALVAAGGAALIARGSSGHCPAYARLGAGAASEASETSAGITVNEAVTVNQPAEVVYATWRDLERLPTFIPALESVTRLDDRRSHWVVNGPAGRQFEWNADAVSDVPNERLAWRTVADADVSSEGTVRFTRSRGGRETIVHVQLQYEPPVAKASALAAWLMGKEPGQLVREALRRFKSFMEAGEPPTVEGQPRGQQSVLNYD